MYDKPNFILSRSDSLYTRVESDIKIKFSQLKVRDEINYLKMTSNRLVEDLPRTIREEVNMGWI